jgi:hypothetical protein
MTRFPNLFPYLIMDRLCRPYNPAKSKLYGLACSRFARRYYRNLF